MRVLEKHPDFKVVAKPDSNWDATTSRNVTTTMLQQHPDLCGIIDFWDGDATGSSAAIRDAGKQGKIFLVTTGGGEKVDCDALESGTFGAVVMTELQNQSRDINAIIKFLLQSGQPPGTSKTYIYTLEKATTKADIKADTCWDLKSLQAGGASQTASSARKVRRGRPLGRPLPASPTSHRTSAARASMSLQ